MSRFSPARFISALAFWFGPILSRRSTSAMAFFVSEMGTVEVPATATDLKAATGASPAPALIARARERGNFKNCARDQLEPFTRTRSYVHPTATGLYVEAWPLPSLIFVLPFS